MAEETVGRSEKTVTVVMASEDARELMKSLSEMRSVLHSMDDKLDRVTTLTDQHDRALRGFDLQAGLLARVSDLEKFNQNLNRVLWAILIPVLGLVGLNLWELLHR